MSKLLTISVVSHGQMKLVMEMLSDIASHSTIESVEVILTLNIPEELLIVENIYPFSIMVIRNAYPQGFGENHNQAFKTARGDFFCVMNPDIRFDKDPFQALLACLEDSSIGVAAPKVMNDNGRIDDSARCFPNPFIIICKAFGMCNGNDYEMKDKPIYPDWAGGMFLLFPRAIFEKLSGFDQRYFLYYEDVDICARLRLLGYEVVVCPQSIVIHHAHRSSHRSFRYLLWHLRSMARFFFSSVYWRAQCLNRDEQREK